MIAAWAWGTVVAGVVGVVLYWGFIERPFYFTAAVIHDGSSTTPETFHEQLEWHAGDTMPVYYAYCNPKPPTGDPVILQSMICDHVFTLPSFVPVPEPAGCHGHTWGITIPRNIQPGRCRLRNAMEYNLNPLRRVRVVAPDVTFTVVP